MALDIRIAGRYRLGRKIGGGSFGDIYVGKHYGGSFDLVLNLVITTLGTNVEDGEEVATNLVIVTVICPPALSRDFHSLLS
jgi:hypothetical protein